MASRLQDVILRGTAAARPAATTLAPGTLYYSTDTSTTDRVADTGLTWETYSDGGSAVSAVPNTGLCQGRLTTESGVGVSTSDRTSQSTIYFTPYLGNRVALYSGSAWAEYTLTERSLALSGLTSGKNYDVFLYNNSGTLTLELSAAWTNDTTRADALALQDGVSVKSGATTRRLVGTLRTTGTTTTEDSAAKRFVASVAQRVRRHAIKGSTSVHAYGTTTWRAWNNDATNAVQFVLPFAGEAWVAHLWNVSISTDSTNTCFVGVGVTGSDGSELQLGGAMSGLSLSGSRAFAGTLGLITATVYEWAGASKNFNSYGLGAELWI